MNFRVLLLFLFVWVSASVFSQNKEKALNKYFTALSANERFNGNVLVAEKGKVVYQHSFGYANFGDKRFNTVKSNFAIMSITKTFVATAMFQLQDKGKLQVTDAIVKYLPEFPYPTMTIAHLLSHTSGLRPYDDYFDSLRLAHPDTVFTNADMLLRYAKLKLPLVFQPGESVQYDNINFMFAAIIIEKITGQKIDDYLRKNIFLPAEMTNTFTQRVSFYHWTTDERKNLSLFYFYPHPYSEKLVKADTVAYLLKYWHCYQITGEGEIISTTADLLKYDQALYSGQLVSNKSLQQAYSPFRLNNGQYNASFFGLGWMVYPDSTMGKIVGYSGGAIGLRSRILRNITKNQTVVIIDNTNNPVDDIASDAVKILNGQYIRPTGKSLAKIYAITLLKKGEAAARLKLNALRKDTLNYDLNEDEFNTLGYDLMNSNGLATLVEGSIPGKAKEAIAVFKLNTELFPDSWNVFDSYGEALLQAGKKEEAIKMYRKSVALNPDNENGKKVLADISK
jgi:CubicO group peptidase (beta-lactamase class C family)